MIRDRAEHFPWGDEELSFTGNKTTVLSEAQTPNDDAWVEKTLGKGKILFSPLPLELSDNIELVGKAYRYALKTSGVVPVYRTTLADPGILIAPTVFPAATLYVLTSESNRQQIVFDDVRSGRRFAGTLESGSAAILLVGVDGKVLAEYNWRVP
jgi:hypothetical protein